MKTTERNLAVWCAAGGKGGQVGRGLLSAMRPLVEEGISTVFPARGSGLGTVQGCGSPRHGEKEKERGNIFFFSPSLRYIALIFLFAFASIPSWQFPLSI